MVSSSLTGRANFNRRTNGTQETMMKQIFANIGAAVFAAALSVFVMGAGIFPGFTPFGSTSPAYPSWTGLETVPLDTNLTAGQNPGTLLANALQLGLPVLVDNTTAGAALTVPNNATIFGLDTGTTTTLTVTFPALPTAGQVLSIGCEIAMVSLTLAPQAGATIKGSPAAGACAVGTAYRFFWNAPTLQWFRF